MWKKIIYGTGKDQNELFFSLFLFFGQKTIWVNRWRKAKMNEKLHKNMGDCRKIHSTSCLSQEKCYTKNVFGCGFSHNHCDFGYALNYFSERRFVLQ